MNNKTALEPKKLYSTKAFLTAAGILLLIVAGIVCGIIALCIDPMVFTVKGSADSTAKIFGFLAWVLPILGSVLYIRQHLKPKKIVYTLDEVSET